MAGESFTPLVMFSLDKERLMSLAARHRDEYLAGEPFPHVMIDDFLGPEALDPILTEFPSPEESEWFRRDNEHEVKLSLNETDKMGPATRALMAELNGQVFMEFLERLTGIEGLIPDPYLFGGGLHQIRRGGYLKVHSDFNRHPRLALDRRLNVLIYLNKDWQDDWGGHFELWDSDMTASRKKIAPVFDRFVVFATTSHSNHGHPDPLNCPIERARRSIALYYYTNGRPAAELAGKHSTLFRARPGEMLRSASFRQRVVRWTPPALTQEFEKFQARRALGQGGGHR